MATAQDQCEMCFEETPVGYCKSCGHIGEACLRIHKKGKFFQTHIINMYEEGEEKTKMIMRDITEESCKEHPKDKAIFLCKAHDCMICGRCLHSGHLSCGKQVVDLLQEAGTIDYDEVNNMKQALTELKDESMRLKEESGLKNETNEVQAAKCNMELDSLETRLKRYVEDIIKNVRKETCKYQDENIEACSRIAAVCDENVVWADDEEKQIEELVTNSFTGHLYLRSKTFNKAVSGAKFKMKENEHKQTFKIFCLKENEIALKCLFEDMRGVCHIQEEVDGSDDGSAVTHHVGNAASAIQKTRKELSDELIQVKRDLAKSEKTRKSFEQELLQARQVIEKSEKERNTSGKELLQAKQVIGQSEKEKQKLCDELKVVKHDLDNSEKARQKLSDELIQVKQELDSSEKMKKGYEAELLRAQQGIEESEERQKTLEKELQQAEKYKQYSTATKSGRRKLRLRKHLKPVSQSVSIPVMARDTRKPRIDIPTPYWTLSASDTSDDGNCVICKDTIVDPKTLPCGHTFCTKCIDRRFKFRKACPICGLILGMITGNQPPGKMTVYVDKFHCCSGYPEFGTIKLNYEFAEGYQTIEHPSPGQYYEGTQETGFLPDNPRGRSICRLLKVAFKRRLVFTIGTSRTQRRDGVMIWNDIRHKTDPTPNSQFGYPDPTYLDRVTEDLALQGVTENDIQKDDMLGESIYSYEYS